MSDIIIDDRKLQIALVNAPTMLRVELIDGFDHSSRSFMKKLYQERMRGLPGIFSQQIHTTFKRQAISNVRTPLQNLGTQIFTESKTALKHELGGTVSDPKGGYIAVPLSGRTNMFTKRGVLKKSFKNPDQYRGTKKASIITMRGKKFLVIWKNKKHLIQEAKGVYVLKDKVTLEARLKFFETWKNFLPRMRQILNTSISRALKRSQ